MVKVRNLIFLLSIFFLSSCGGDWLPISLDENLGYQSSQQVEENGFFKIVDESEYPEAYSSLNKLKDKILASGQLKHRDDFRWELKIIEDDSVLNAFCLPGGYIYVFTGLIKYLPNESALAGVLGHEMAHADMRHGTKQMVKNMGIGLILQFIFGVDNSSLLNIGANLLSLSFSRSDEKEADLKSVNYLYATDYDARGVATFFEKLKKENKDPELIEFISTHPNPDNRIEEILKEWKRLGAKKGEKYTNEYQILKNNLP
jgi:beta-barrel assembly-enhancing protease